MTDLSKLPAPNVMEVLDYQRILDGMKAQLIEKDPEFSALVESDPAIKILEICAWRELLLRQRINNAAHANLLAFSTNADLEHLGAFYNVQRQSEESDERYRVRISAKISGWSTAGSKAHYVYHALSADPRVKHARAESPEPGLVRISVLSNEGDGTPTKDLLQSVRRFITQDHVRVLTDTVEVVGVTMITLHVKAHIELETGVPPTLLRQIESNCVHRFRNNQKLGWSVHKCWLLAQLFTEGVKHVELLSPVEDVVVQPDECVALQSVTLL